MTKQVYELFTPGQAVEIAANDTEFPGRVLESRVTPNGNECRVEWWVGSARYEAVLPETSLSEPAETPVQ